MDSNKSEKETRGDLPCGWVRQVDIRETGHRVYCIVTNTGEILRSQRQLNQYLTDNSLGPVLLRGEASEISHTNDEAPNHDCDTEDVKVNNRVGTKKQKENVNPQTKNVPEVGGKEDDQEESNDEEELFKDELEYIRDVENFLKGTDLDLIPSPPTKGDGNCWYRAAADQASLHRLPVAPIDHQQMRLRVCDHLKSLPRQVKEDTINVVFVGKPRGLSDLAHRQRKPGQWVDNMGVMVLATAHFLGRNIHLIGYPPSGASCERGYSLTCIEGGEEGEAHPPLTIFYHDRHYQTLRPPSSTASQPQSNQ